MAPPTHKHTHTCKLEAFATIRSLSVFFGFICAVNSVKWMEMDENGVGHCKSTQLLPHSIHEFPQQRSNKTTSQIFTGLFAAWRIMTRHFWPLPPLPPTASPVWTLQDFRRTSLCRWSWSGPGPNDTHCCTESTGKARCWASKYCSWSQSSFFWCFVGTCGDRAAKYIKILHVSFHDNSDMLLLTHSF